LNTRPALGQSETGEWKANPLAEEWVREQVIAGQAADLADPNAKLPKEQDRVLTASFVKGLLTNSDERARVDWRGIEISNAVVYGKVDLSHAKIPYHIGLVSCHFSGPVDFTDAQIDGNADFSNSVFEDEFSLIGANITSSLLAREAKFQNRSQPVWFDSLKIGKYAFFNDAVFDGPVTFLNAEVNEDFEAIKTHFNNPDTDVVFNNMKVGQDAQFVDAVFQGSARFKHAHVGDFFADRAQFNFVEGAILNNKSRLITFEDMKVDSTIVLTDTIFKGHPELLGMTYQRIDTGSWESLLALFERARFSADTYKNLEDALQRAGHADQANEAYIAMRWRERKENLTFLGFSWLLNLLWWVLVGYGRRPWLAFVWSALFILYGWWLYRKRSDMVAKRTEDFERRDYKPFWYSLSLFLPFVDLDSSSVWQPRYDRSWSQRWRLFYMRIHILLGWMLIPIGLAAWSGIIK
jgi:hypothetical protein